MQAWEWIAAAYFVYLLALVPRVDRARRARLLAPAVAAPVVIVALAQAPQTPLILTARRWLPAAYVLLGYYLSALFFRTPMRTWEARLAAFDERWFVRTSLLSRISRSPRWLREFLELAYFVCPALVPAGALVFGFAPSLTELQRYWTPMLLAEFVSYGSLPWIQTRPPRAVEPAQHGRAAIAAWRLNAWMVRFGHHGYNTFPSGHVAAACTAALVASMEAPAVGAALLPLSVAIAAGSVVGRYHYLLDAIAGALVAGAAVAATRVLG